MIKRLIPFKREVEEHSLVVTDVSNLEKLEKAYSKTKEVTVVIDSETTPGYFINRIKYLNILDANSKGKTTLLLEANHKDISNYLSKDTGAIRKGLLVDKSLLDRKELKTYLDLINKQNIAIYKKGYSAEGLPKFPIVQSGLYLGEDVKCPTIKLDLKTLKGDDFKSPIKQLIKKGRRKQIGVDFVGAKELLKREGVELTKFANALAKLVNLVYPFYWLDIEPTATEYKLAKYILEMYTTASKECRKYRLESAFNTSDLVTGERVNWTTELLLYSSWQKMLDDTGYGHSVVYPWSKGRLTQEGLIEWFSTPIKSLVVRRAE